MKKKFCFTISSILLTTLLFAQTERFDIASFTPPQGWQRIDTNGTVAFITSTTANGLTSFCQIILYPSTSSNGNADKEFKTAWQNLVAVPLKTSVKPSVQTSKEQGWTAVTGAANVTLQSLTYKTIVTSLTGFGKTMNVQVNTAGGDYAAILDKFFNDLDLDSKATVSINQSNTIATTNMKDYEFITPEQWQVQNNKDHIAIINPRSGCAIRIFTPQLSSGNLEKDVNAVFDMMYKGWNYQKSGEQQYLLAKGILPKGQEYCRKEATMTGHTADGLYHLQEGTAMVVKAGNQMVIISQNHNNTMLGHDDCYKNYNTVARFINSFAIKNVTAKANDEDAAKRIVGLWKVVATGVVVGDYVFAANGNYQYGGGIGSSTTTSDSRYEYIYNRAYPFQGDGSYFISGNQLTLKKSGAAETVAIRFEKISHGGTAWTDRIYMLKKDGLREYESVYEKQTK